MNRLLLEAPVGRLFARYLLPTVCATLVTAIYLFADTVMVGYRLGAEGVAALNLIVPLEFAFFAVGSLLGNGGGICFTRRLSVGDVLGARRCFAVAVCAAAIFAAVATTLCLVFLRPLVAHVLGAGEGPFLEAAVSYGLPIAAGCPLFVATLLLAPFLRHDHAPRRAMAAVLAGGITNIVLDWVFMYPLNMGLFGAGLATTCGAGVTTVILLTHLRSPARALRWERPEWRLLPIYGVVANYLLTMTAVFNGVAQAAHPLTAANAAAGARTRVRKILRLALGTAAGFGVVALLIAVTAPTLCLRAFLPAAEVAALPSQAAGALATALFCLPLMGMAQIATLQLPAVGRPARGTLFACLRSGALLLERAFRAVVHLVGLRGGGGGGGAAPALGPRGLPAEGTADAAPENRERRTENRTRGKRATGKIDGLIGDRFHGITRETQGMGTVVRRNAPNGEVPSPLRPFVLSGKPSSVD